MKRISQVFGVIFLGSFFALSGTAIAQKTSSKTEADHRKEDIARHRAMSAAHEAAAKCMESGKPEDVCVAELTKACKGLAIGKYCGMKH